MSYHRDDLSYRPSSGGRHHRDEGRSGSKYHHRHTSHKRHHHKHHRDAKHDRSRNSKPEMTPKSPLLNDSEDGQLMWEHPVYDEISLKHNVGLPYNVSPLLYQTVDFSQWDYSDLSESLILVLEAIIGPEFQKQPKSVRLGVGITPKPSFDDEGEIIERGSMPIHRPVFIPPLVSISAPSSDARLHDNTQDNRSYRGAAGSASHNGYYKPSDPDEEGDTSYAFDDTFSDDIDESRESDTLEGSSYTNDDDISQASSRHSVVTTRSANTRVSRSSNRGDNVASSSLLRYNRESGSNNRSGGGGGGSSNHSTSSHAPQRSAHSGSDGAVDEEIDTAQLRQHQRAEAAIAANDNFRRKMHAKVVNQYTTMVREALNSGLIVDSIRPDDLARMSVDDVNDAIKNFGELAYEESYQAKWQSNLRTVIGTAAAWNERNKIIPGLDSSRVPRINHFISRLGPSIRGMGQERIRAKGGVAQAMGSSTTRFVSDAVSLALRFGAEVMYPDVFDQINQDEIIAQQQHQQQMRAAWQAAQQQAQHQAHQQASHQQTSQQQASHQQTTAQQQAAQASRQQSAQQQTTQQQASHQQTTTAQHQAPSRQQAAPQQSHQPQLSHERQPPSPVDAVSPNTTPSVNTQVDSEQVPSHVNKAYTPRQRGAGMSYRAEDAPPSSRASPSSPSTSCPTVAPVISSAVSSPHHPVINGGTTRSSAPSVGTATTTTIPSKQPIPIEIKVGANGLPDLRALANAHHKRNLIM